MHHLALFTLMTAAMASRSVILEAPDDTCGYLNGKEQAPFGCLNSSEKCAIYYPTSSMAAPTTMLQMITPAPQPSVVCYEPSRGDCTVQPTACIDTLGDCTGTCSDDPMTLKCTAGPHLYCNRAHFESPLSFRNIWAIESRLRSTDAPADGWFCGTAAIPVQQVDASHSKTVSMPHISQSSVNPTTTLGVTITLSRPGQTPGLSPMSSPSATVVSEHIDCEDNNLSTDDCCFDEQDPVEPCYNEASRARLQRRQTIGGSTTAASPVFAPKDALSRGFAIVSTEYVGQTTRRPLIEATRPWKVILPTAVATSTTEAAGPRLQPFPRKCKNRLNKTVTIIAAILGGLVIITIVSCVWRKLKHRLSSRRQQLSTQHQDGHKLAGYPEHVSKRREKYLQNTMNFVSVKDRADDGGSQQIPLHCGHVPEQSGPVVAGQPVSDLDGVPGLASRVRPGSALRRHEQASRESGEATDGSSDGPEPQSEESLEQGAYENAIGIAVSGSRNRAYKNVP